MRMEGARVGVEVAVQGLTKSFGRQNIWSDVTLTLPPGEISVLLGPSGTGKSVFLKSLVGLLETDRGHIIIGDPELNAEWKRRWQARPKDQMRHAITVTIGLEDLRPRLAEVRCPAVVIHGVDDVAFSREQAEATASAIPTAGDPVWVPGGHAACMSHPHETNKAIRDFLATL